MHRSRLTEIIVDCSPETIEASIDFWSRALGRPAHRPADPAIPYTSLEGQAGQIDFALQRVNDRSRIHLDIETDNVEAEVARLEALGASRVSFIKRWWVMRDPSGILFCVVPVQTRDFDHTANTWA